MILRLESAILLGINAWLLEKLYFQTLLLDLSKCVDRLFELFTALYNWGKKKKYSGEGQPRSLFRPFRVREASRRARRQLWDPRPEWPPRKLKINKV